MILRKIAIYKENSSIEHLPISHVILKQIPMWVFYNVKMKPII